MRSSALPRCRATVKKKVADPFGARRCVLRAEQIPTQFGQAQTQFGMAVDQDGLPEVEDCQPQTDSYSNPTQVVKRSRAFRRPYPAEALTPRNTPNRIAISGACRQAGSLRYERETWHLTPDT